MRRMIAFVTGQRLPNFIALNEPATRPDALHLIYTPGDRDMDRSLRDLLPVVERRFETMLIASPLKLDDPYDGQQTRRLCESLLKQHPEDEWTLNATGGTKLMSAPVMDLFMSRDLPVLYVETPNRRTVRVRKDWSSEALPFTGSIDLETYFALHGAVATSNASVTPQERELLQALQSLDWQVWPSVRLSRDGVPLHEYDVVGIDGYQLSVFECKRINPDPEHPQATKIRQRHHHDVREDLLKLFQVRQQFGGPFGRSYWCLSGGYQLSEEERGRIADFQVTLISGYEIREIRRNPAKFSLPPARRPAEHGTV